MTTDASRIELDQDAVTVGEAIRGRVILKSDESPSAVEVILLWRTSGDFESEENEIARCKITDANGEARFILQVPPAGPMTYSGQTFSVNWFVRVADEPATEVPIFVNPSVMPPKLNS